MNQNNSILSHSDLIKLAKVKASALLSERVNSKALAICEVTGIAITLDIPAIEGIALDYTNPLAEPRNFLQLASLSPQILAKQSPAIISGLYLAITKYYELVECPLTSAEQNLYLQTIPPMVLIESIRFFSVALPSYHRIHSLPRICFAPKDSMELQTSTPTNQIKAYKEALHEAIYPTLRTTETMRLEAEINTLGAERIKNTSLVAKAILRARTSKKVHQQEQQKIARELVSSLADYPIISPKLVAFLKLLVSKDTLLTAEQETKDRAIRALAKYSYSSCTKLIAILKDNSISDLPESIFQQENDLEVEESIQAVEEEVKPKLTLAEILAAKRKGN